jgi:sodium transport system ATP-binding protein
VIEIQGLRKSFGSVAAVRDVSFSAADGTVVGLLGPNGAGKTTTLRMLSGLMRPDAGTIRVDDADVVADPIGAQTRMGVLPDSRGLYPRLTPIEHIEYAGRLHGLDGSALTERTKTLIALLGLNEVANRRVSGFSQGERTKVALARALVHKPRNVILDEPTNGLDVMSTRAMRELIRGLRRDGCCVLFSSHIMQEVAALCDRIVVIAQGTVVADGTPDELRSLTGRDNLEDAFVALAGLETEEDAEEAL